jgi:hypothetical protein
MNIYETLGLVWVIFTSGLATIGLLYFAYRGLKLSFNKDRSSTERPEEGGKTFKIAS